MTIDKLNGEFRKTTIKIDKKENPRKAFKTRKLPPEIEAIRRRQMKIRNKNNVYNVIKSQKVIYHPPRPRPTKKIQRKIQNYRIKNSVNNDLQSDSSENQAPYEDSEESFEDEEDSYESRVKPPTGLQKIINPNITQRRKESIDEYEDDFIDDTEANNNGNYTKIVRSTCKALFGNSIDDFKGHCADDIQEVGFNQIMHEEEITRVIGRKEDDLELKKMETN